MLPFPKQKIERLAQHSLLGEFFQNCANILELENWPSCLDWNRAKGEGLAALCLESLQFEEEIRLGARRRQRERKEARLLPGLRSYEAKIVERGVIPTRPAHPHDFFNALVWLRFPKSKRVLHQRSYALQKSGVGLESANRRSRTANSLTCFDEGGVIYLCPSNQERTSVIELFRSRNDIEKCEFIRLHADKFFIFGHGLMEGLLADRFDVHVSCFVIPSESGAGRVEQDTIDSLLAQSLEALIEDAPVWGTVPFAPIWDRETPQTEKEVCHEFSLS